RRSTAVVVRAYQTRPQARRIRDRQDADRPQGAHGQESPPQEKVGQQSPSCGCVTLSFVGKRKFDTLQQIDLFHRWPPSPGARRRWPAALANVLASCGRWEDTTYDQRTRPSDSQSTAGLGS